MRLRLHSFRRLIVLALPCWLLGGPVASTLLSIAACPHHDAMPSPMGHGAESQSPCWCTDMSSAAPTELPGIAAAQPEPGALLTHVLLLVSLSAPRTLLAPPSPAFPPTPPPPNGRA